MNLTQKTSSLEDCFRNYEKIQVQHLNFMKSEDLPDLSLMTEERTKAFQLLKTTLDSFIQNAGTHYGSDSLSILNGYESRLSLMMKLDEDISGEIQKYRNSLKTNLNRMKKGKMAMTGYKNSAKNSQSPRVLSMNR